MKRKYIKKVHPYNVKHLGHFDRWKLYDSLIVLFKDKDTVDKEYEYCIKLMPKGKHSLSQYLKEPKHWYSRFNANRYYAETNPDISNLMNKEITENPVVFLNRLRERWNWHNSYYEDLFEKAYSRVVKDDYKELSPKEIDDLIKIYNTSVLVDEATLVTSGVIKKYLNNNIKYIPTDTFGLEKNEAQNMLPTLLISSLRLYRCLY